MNGWQICTSFPSPMRCKGNIAVAMSFSKEYLHYSNIAIYSILKNSSPQFFYDIVILADSPEAFENEVFGELRKRYDNVSFRAVDIGSFGLSEFFVEGHLANETYSRLLIPKIFSKYQKVVYLDSDILVCRDISELYNFPISDDTMIAGVPDIDLIGQCYGADSAMRYYLRSKVRVDCPERYLQAGVLVFNIDKIRSSYGDNALIYLAQNTKLRYFDQDILNYAFKNNIQLIDFRWNVVSDCDSIRISKIIAKAPPEMFEQYMESRKDPWIIHYSGYVKPWEDSKTDMADRYWDAVNEADLLSLPNSLLPAKTNNGIKRLFKNVLFPYGTIRRKMIKTFLLGVKYKKIKETRIL